MNPGVSEVGGSPTATQTWSDTMVAKVAVLESENRHLRAVLHNLLTDIYDESYKSGADSRLWSLHSRWARFIFESNLGPVSS